MQRMMLRDEFYTLNSVRLTFLIEILLAQRTFFVEKKEFDSYVYVHFIVMVFL